MPGLRETMDGVGTPEAGTRRIAGAVASWYVANILRGAPPPLNAPFGRIAYKTGTSYGYRDAFAIGFDKAHTIAVWLGRPDNGSVFGLAKPPRRYCSTLSQGSAPGTNSLRRLPVFSRAGPPRFPRPCAICARTCPRIWRRSRRRN